MAALLCLLMLAGCSASDGAAKVNNDTEVLFSGKGVSYTKGKLFNTLKSYDYSSFLFYDMVYKCAVADGADLSSYEEEANATIDMYKAMYGEDIMDGYGGEDVFRKMLMMDGYVSDKAKEFVDGKLEDYAKEDLPILAKLAYFDSEEAANKVIAAVNEGSTFEMAAAENGYNLQIQDTIYIDSSDVLPLTVKEYVNTSTENGLSPVLVSMVSTTDAEGKTVETPRYYLISITSRDYNEFRDQYASLKASGVDTNEVVKTLIFADHKISFYDQDVMDLMKKTYPGVFD